jgi:hypothetical protein
MAKTDRGSTSLAAATIERHHNLLTQNLSEEEAFKFPVIIEEIRAYERQDWERLREPILFVLRTKEKVERMKTVLDRQTGRREVVLRLEPDPKVKRSPVPLDWWVGWSEEWQPGEKIQRQFQFTFKKAGWRLYCTDQNDKDTLLVRAEWDRPDEDNLQNAAQPHWHVHHQQKIGTAAAPFTTAQRASMPADASVPLDEGYIDSDKVIRLQAYDESTLMVAPPKWVEIRDIHLGMARWDNKGAHPKCWQSPFGNLEETMRSWAVATLKYMRTQLCYVRFAQPD